MDEDRVQYCLDFEKGLRMLEEQLHSSDDLKEISAVALKASCDFYDGDWAGFLDVDLDLKLWTPYWWYNTASNDQTERLLGEIESTDYLDRWIETMHNNQAVIIPDVKCIQFDHPYEYQFYQRLGINSILAVPVKPRPTGFLVVRNPRRYVTESSMLKMHAFVVLSMVNESKLQDRLRAMLSPSNIQDERDVYIRLFGELEIYTSKGVLVAKDFKSPKICRLIGYLLLNPRTNHPPQEIADAIWPDDQSDADDSRCNAVRGLIYRSRQTFSLISNFQLIISTSLGYSLNPDLHIVTDLSKFDEQWESIRCITSTSAKIEIMKRIVELYRGHILNDASSDHWLINTANRYCLRYRGIVNELLKMLAEAKDYDSVQHYATRSLDIYHGNLQAHYWLIYAMCQMGAFEMAKCELVQARSDLTFEEYNELQCLIKKTPFASAFWQML